MLSDFQIVLGMALICLLALVLALLLSYQRRARERSLDKKTHLYRALSETLDMAVNLYCPKDGTVTPIVAKAANILGYSLPELMDNPKVMSELAFSEAGRKLVGQLQSGSLTHLVQGEFSLIHPRTRKQTWASFSVSPLESEEKCCYLVVLRDITKEKELQISMKDAMTAADAANRAKSEFLSRMSHEIRTPMNAIIGLLQIAKLHVEEPLKTEENLKKIGTASDHLLNLINDVLDISKIESGKMVLNSAPFRLSSLLDDVTAVIRPQCEHHQQTLEVVAPDVDEVLVGDAMRLRQMLINLLTNAVKYTPAHGAIRLEALLHAESVTMYRCVTFVVSDNGIGMSEEFKNKMFEPFLMEGRVNAQGTGLGMPIVKNIVTMMGGSIDVVTSIDQGTTFEVDISMRVALDAERRKLEEAEREDAAWEELFDVSGRPVEAPRAEGVDVACSGLHDMHKRVIPPADQAARGVQAAGEALAASSAHSAHPTPLPTASPIPARLVGLRILLAEDNELNAEIARELLKEAGLEVDWAENGEEACSLFSRSSEGYYDAVLMDVQMPVMDGFEATRTIRAYPRSDAHGIPIIAMSANAFAEDVRASLASGMDAHLSKPMDLRHVLETLAVQLQKSHFPS